MELAVLRVLCVLCGERSCVVVLVAGLQCVHDLGSGARDVRDRIEVPLDRLQLLVDGLHVIIVDLVETDELQDLRNAYSLPPR